MFRGPAQIEPVIGLLEEREASLWHACQLVDLQSYLAVGGIPSRSLLEHAGMAFTSFQTDGSDRSRGVWSKVFANLNDFGETFAHGGNATPNAYGPIVFQIKPRAMARAIDVAITLRSAGAADFDRDSESLGSLNDVDRLFMYPATAPFPERCRTTFRDGLRESFAPRYPDAVNAELSLTMEPELMPMADVIAIWVDPLEVSGGLLVDVVKSAVSASRWSGRVHERTITAERRTVLADVSRFLVDGPPPARLRLLQGRRDISDETKAWASALLERDLEWMFQRYGQYLVDGTLTDRDEVPVESDQLVRRAAESPEAYRPSRAASPPRGDTR